LAIKDSQSLRPTAGQLRVLTLLSRGMVIERAITRTVGNGSPPTLRYIADDGDATVLPRPSVDACIARGWVDVGGALRLRLTDAGKAAAINFNQRSRYNLGGR
jgi:hypothetical protein